MAPDTEDQLDSRLAQTTETTSLLDPSKIDPITQTPHVENVAAIPTAKDPRFNEDATTWQRETLVILKSASPLVVTFMCQYTLLAASIFSVGHIGKTELAGVTMGNMCGSVSGLSIFIGLATGLDTMCAQAYGSGQKKLVGVYLQRMLCFFAVLIIPIVGLWFFSKPVLLVLLSDPEVADLASRYLRVLIFGAPAFASFECGKRYLQAQGIFSGSTYVVIFVAPINAVLNWFLVWKLQWGFIGAPISVVVSQNLMASGLFLYAYFFVGRDCWGGFSKSAFKNWGPMLKLSVPGFVMIVAEFFGFQVLTFAASHINTTTLAAESIVHSTIAVAFQLPFPVAIAASNRIGNLIGATLEQSARTATRVALYASVIIGLFNAILMSLLRNHIPYLYNSDPQVVRLASQVLPVCAAFQLFDSVAAHCNGILRGVGRQKFGGYAQLFGYYVIGIPISMATAFPLGWGLWGLWFGIAIALAVVTVIELFYISRLDWQRCIKVATSRSLQG